MGYGTDGVTFNTLRGANRNRQTEWPGNDKADMPFRALEVAGEAGELCEAVKKYLHDEQTKICCECDGTGLAADE